MPAYPERADRIIKAIDAFKVDDNLKATQILRRLGQTHRKQESRVFASEGGEGAAGTWPALSPRYAAWKRKFLGTGGKLLVLNKPYRGRSAGQLKDSFTKKEAPGYVQQYQKPYLQFGSRDPLAVSHFLGIAPLPKRDMMSKTQKQLDELTQAIKDWWTNERLPQILRGLSRLGAR